MKPFNGRYVLDGHNPLPEPDLMKWGEWMEGHDNRRVAVDVINGVRVSTVFLGLDHQWGIGEPLLFETMTFEGPQEIQQRCSTWDEAVEQHRQAIETVKGWTK